MHYYTAQQLWCRICHKENSRETGGTKIEMDTLVSDLHNKELYELYSLPKAISVTKSRRMRRGGGACGMHERKETRLDAFAGGSVKEKGDLKT
jgi:hypothetical protein